MTPTPEQKNKAEELVRNAAMRAKNCGLCVPSNVNIHWVYEHRNRLGYVRYNNNNTIFLNTRYINTSWFWQTTILHELAHLITFASYPNAKQDHGPEFRRVCSILGISGDTYAKKGEDFPERIRRNQIKYVLGCPRCAKEYTVTKRGHTKVYGASRYYICSCGGAISSKILRVTS